MYVVTHSGTPFRDEPWSSEAREDFGSADSTWLVALMREIIGALFRAVKRDRV